MIELTQLQQEILAAEGALPRVLNPRTNQTYVLITAEQYERLSSLLDPGPLTEEERRVILQGVWRRASWDDPRMDDYDKFAPQQES